MAKIKKYNPEKYDMVGIALAAMGINFPKQDRKLLYYIDVILTRAKAGSTLKDIIQWEVEIQEQIQQAQIERETPKESAPNEDL